MTACPGSRTLETMYLLGLLLGLLIVLPSILLYFLFLKGMDRYEPEPLWLLALLLAWGAGGATLSAMSGNAIGEHAIVLALGADPADPLVNASTATFVAPLVEETTKGFGLLLLWLASAYWLKELDGPLDGAIFGGVVGLGFTLTEDLLYLAATFEKDGLAAFGVLFAVRTVLSGLGHATFTAMTGLGIGLAADARGCAPRVLLPVAGWMAAVLLHLVHNLLVTFLWSEGLGLLAKLLFFWGFDMLFFALILALVLRDRRLVRDGLADEVGTLLQPAELERTVSLWMLMPLWNRLQLASNPAGYHRTRSKQLALIELALLKRRRQRGESDLGLREQRLRNSIDEATRNGIMVA